MDFVRSGCCNARTGLLNLSGAMHREGEMQVARSGHCCSSGGLVHESHAQVRLAGGEVHGLPSLREHLLGLLVGHGRRDHHRLTLLPVRWRGDLVPGRKLQRVNHTQHLVEVAPGCTWVQKTQLQLHARYQTKER
jgi:hypothetical protein